MSTLNNFRLLNTLKIENNIFCKRFICFLFFGYTIHIGFNVKNFTIKIKPIQFFLKIKTNEEILYDKTILAYMEF